jgi:tetratricopeptide (TPR) repeat protein
VGNREQSASVLNSIASIYSLTGDHAKAKEFFGRTLVIFEEMGHLGRMAGVLNNLGVTAKNLGLYAEGIAYYERSIALKSQLGGRGLTASRHQPRPELHVATKSVACCQKHEVTRERRPPGRDQRPTQHRQCLGGPGRWEDSLGRAGEAVGHRGDRSGTQHALLVGPRSARARALRRAEEVRGARLRSHAAEGS